MAEKEDKYISITQMVAKENIETEKYRVMPRQEAIERIARAICRSEENECIGDCASCDLWKVGPEKDYAEVALNALLEGGK